MDDFERGPDGRSTDLPSGRGVPPWLSTKLNFCSSCGASLRFGAVTGEDRHRLSCPECGHIAYVNPRLVVTTLADLPQGRIELLFRGTGRLGSDDRIGPDRGRRAPQHDQGATETGDDRGPYEEFEDGRFEQVEEQHGQ